MKPAPFLYVAATSLEHAFAVLDEYGDEAKVMAGGQSLMPLLSLRLAFPAVVIDLGRLDGLRASEDTGDGCIFGATTVHASFETGAVPDPTRGLLPAAAAGIGYRAIRNRGTVGGSLCHADSSAEWPLVMSALNARLTARSSRGERSIPAREFVRGFFTHTLEDDEILTRVRVDALAPSVQWGLHKSARKPGEFSESLAVVLVDLDEDRVRGVDAWLGAAADVPLEIAGLSALEGRTIQSIQRQDVLDLVEADLGPAPDAPQRYRRRLHAITMWRAFAKVGGHDV